MTCSLVWQLVSAVFSYNRDIDMAEFLSSDPAVQDAHPHSTYDLIANICHDGQAGSGKGTYRVHIRHKVGVYLCK